jgi:hypothetical protein
MKKKKNKGFPWGIFIVIGFCLICVCALGVWLGHRELLGASTVWSNNDSAAIASQMTATAQSRAATVAKAYAIATVRATDPARAATIAKIAGETATAREEGILFYDDFTTDVHDWRQGEFPGNLSDTTLQLASGKYKYSLRSKHEAVIRRELVPDFSADDFRLSVNVTVRDLTSAVKGIAGVGITFRENDAGEYYQVIYWNDNSYQVCLHLPHQELPVTIHDRTWQAAIWLERNVPDTFAILVKGSRFTIYANGVELTTVQDSTLNQAGKVGLALDLNEKGHMLTAEFDELTIQKAP